MATAATVYRDYETDGIPSSGAHKVRKPEIRQLLAGYEGVINAFLSNGGLIFASKASLDASLNYAANTMAWVLGDATVANNGIYRKIGGSGTGSWTRVADLPFSFIIASDVGAGTVNAIQATTSIPVSGSALVWMNVFEANTASPVTVSFNGGSALTIKTNTGNNVAAGGLVAGMIVLGIVSGSTFRLVSDQASAAIVAAAEAAQAAAEAAQAAAEATVSETVRYDIVQAKSAAQKLQARTNIAASSSGNDAQFLAGTSRYPTSINQRVDSASWLAANTVSGKNLVVGAAALDGLTWVNDIMPGTDGVGVVTAYAISTNGKYGSVDAVRASDNVAGTPQNIIAHTAVCRVDNATVAHRVWAKYTHAWWDAGAHVDSFLLGEENSLHNEGAAAAMKTPWDLRGGSSNNGQTANLRLTAGTGNVASNRATCALQITANNAKYASGVIVASDAIDTTSGYADAFAMSTNHGVAWYSPSSADRMWRIFCNVTSVSAGGSLIFGDGLVELFNGDLDLKTGGRFYKYQGIKVVGARDTGWTAMTGTTNKATAYDTSSITLSQLAGRVMALQAALTTHGLIGA
ncbi:hypothetical protein AB4Z34_33465 [Ensifer sp. 2YAB10]|uniref:hypothetical protein n=1 Tax=unclassified Ensifer TaxID=2633371 RepID=UPI003F93C898